MREREREREREKERERDIDRERKYVSWIEEVARKRLVYDSV